MGSSSQLSFEIKKISDKTKCGSDSSYTYSNQPLIPSDTPVGLPFIDQVIYREWNSEITFKETSTVFHRVQGRIKFYKSKVDNNKGNPIIINDQVNNPYWEPINDCSEYKTFSAEFVATEGQTEFELDYTPDAILLVSVNGQGPLRKIDYSLVDNIVTILPPNNLEAGSEVVIIATYDNDQIIINPANERRSANENFVFGGNYAFNLSRIPIYVRSVVVNGYTLGTDLFSYSLSNTAVLILVDAPDFVLNNGDKVFIEYDYREV